MGMSEPAAEPMPIVKILIPCAAASLATTTAFSSKSSPSVMMIKARLVPSPFPKAISAVRIASEILVPPLGMRVVSSSASDVVTA